MNRQWLVSLAVLFLILIPSPWPAKADLLVAPTRVVLDDRTRSVQVSLSNTTQETRTYRVGWTEYVALEDGSYAVPPAPRADSTELQKIVRFSPRQVTLAPGEVQSVRILMRSNDEIPDGEMRTHLTFTALPPEQPASEEDSSAGIGIDLKFALAISIPVIFRKGDLSSDVKIASAGLQTYVDEQQQPRTLAAVTLVRAGSSSVFGDLEILAEGGRMVGLLRGLAVYLEVPQRVVRLPVDLPPGKNAGTLTARFRLPATEGGAILSEARFGD